MARRALDVYLDGIPVGELSQDTHGSPGFIYDADYRRLDGATPLSLSLPLGADRQRPAAVRAFAAGLLPDSEEALRRIGREYGANPNNPFALLEHVGRDAAGAVQIVPAGEPAPDAAHRTGDISWLSGEAFADLAASLADHTRDWDPGRYGGRWSLAGAQSKIALFQDPETRRWGIPGDSTPTTHIIKPGVEAYADHHVNETLCQRAAAYAGIPSALTELVEAGSTWVLVSKRYDRVQRQGDDGRWRWVRLHQEDMCQALAVHPSQKYQTDGGPGVGEIADLFATHALSDDRAQLQRRFFVAFAFNALIGGTDAHAKNYSLMMQGRSLVLAPLYDSASAACYGAHENLRAAMKIGKARRFLQATAADWDSVGRRLGLGAGEGAEVVESLRELLPAALAEAVADVADMAPSLAKRAERMAGRIVEHVDGLWRPDQSADPRYKLPTVREVSERR